MGGGEMRLPDQRGVVTGAREFRREAAARAAIEVLGEGGGLILGPGCALPPRTPPENIHTLIETAKKYGVYA